MAGKRYQGHPSYNAWNVSLWINNDEGLYRRAVELCRAFGMKRGPAKLFAELEGDKTPDGVRYSATTVRLACADILS